MTIISDLEGLRRLSEKLSTVPRLGLDYEGSSSHPHPKAPLHHDKILMVGYGIGLPDGDKYYVPISHTEGQNAPYAEAFLLLEKLLADEEKEIWAHNSKFEYTASRSFGITPKITFQCSMIAQWLLGKGLQGGRGLKLKPAVKEYLKYDMDLFADVVSAGGRSHEAPIEKMGEYCSDDALYTLRLGELWIPEMKELKLYDVFQRLECPFAEVLSHMKESGFKLDVERIHSVREELLEAMKEPEEEFFDLTGVEISKNQQISKRMYDDLGWWPRGKFERGKSGYISIDQSHRKNILDVLPKGSKGYRAAELKNQHSVLEKLVSTYTISITSVAALSLDGRLRGDFNQTGTSTGRLSSASPNLQNIPSSGRGIVIRETFIAEDGWVICDADYSGADLVMMSHLSKDEMMLTAFREAKDLHQQTADYCKCDRKTGKVMNLGLIYEMQVKTLAKNLSISQKSAKIIYNEWHNTYPDVQKYHKRMHAYARHHGFVRTITGRVRFLPNINSKDFRKRSVAERESSNCVDFETEALTKRGWVKGPDLLVSDWLLTKNIDTGFLDWQQPKGIRVFPDYDGELVEFKTRNFSAVSTPDHRWMVRNKATGKDECVTTNHISGHGDHRIHRTGVYRGVENGAWTDDEVRLIGWFVTDGSLCHYKSVITGRPTSFRIMQSQRANPINVEEIEALVRRVYGISVGFHRRDSDTLCVWSLAGITARKITEYFPRRILTMDFLTSLTNDQCQILFSTMIKGDGWGGTKDCFCSKTKEAIDLFQLLGTLVGKAVSIKYRDMSGYSPRSEKMSNIPKMTGYWTATVLKRERVQVLFKHKRRLPSRGVWCPIVPNTYFVARREGTVYITGNTPDQGSVADVIKIAMRNLYQEWRSRGVLYDYWTKEGVAKILSQVHDELIVELREDFAVEGAADVQRHMENAVELRAPMRASPGLGSNWLAAKKNADVMDTRRKKETDFNLEAALGEQLRSLLNDSSRNA